MKPFTRRTLCAALALALALPLTACGPAPAPEPETYSFFAMDTVMDFTVYGGEAPARRNRGDGKAATLPEAAADRVRELESRVSVTDSNSEIARLNQAGEGELSPETAALLETALDLCRRTGGALDISIYPVVRAWGFTTGENQAADFPIPTFDETDLLSQQVDYTKIRLEGTAVSLPEGMEIDLGGVAKGYAGREAASYLREQGVSSALLNLGGNVQTVGAKPDGSPWRVAVQDPEGEGYAGVLEIVNRAAVTSGGYQRYFIGEDGQVYWHIMDPDTARPAKSGLISVTVVAEDGAVCDALSTALFVMGAEKAERFWRRNRDLDFGMVLITEEGEILVTPDLSFTMQADAPYTVRTLEE